MNKAEIPLRWKAWNCLTPLDWRSSYSLVNSVFLEPTCLITNGHGITQYISSILYFQNEVQA